MNSLDKLNDFRLRADHALTACARPGEAATAAEAVAETREADYLANPTESAGKAALDARRAADEARHLADLIEKAGGPAGARLRRLHTPEGLALLASVFGEREKEIASRLKGARTVLAAGVAELVAEGMNASLAPLHPSLTPARERVARLAGAAQAAFQDRAYCERGRWEAGRTFDELFAAATAEIPN